MPKRGNVRTHTRRTAGGGTTTVHQHSRTGRPIRDFAGTARPVRGPLGGRKRRRRSKRRGGIFQAGRAFQTLGWAYRAARKRRRATAVGLAALGAGELAGWIAFRGLGVALTTVAVLAGGLGLLAMRASGGER